MASRSLDDLQPAVRLAAKQVLKLFEDEGFDLLIYCTYRSHEEQARLYRQGRHLSAIHKKAEELENYWNRPDLAGVLLGVGPQSGRKVTNAGPGQSYHAYRLAFDAVPLVNGKAVWGTRRPEDKALWMAYGECVTEAGLTWSGGWTRFKEYPHSHKAGANWRDLIREGPRAT